MQMSRNNPLDRVLTNDASVPVPSPGGTLSLIPSARQVKRDAMTEERIARRKASRAAFDRKFPSTSYFIPAHLRELAREIKRDIASLAHQKRTTVASLASAMISWSLNRVRKGSLVIDGYPQSDRRKLSVVMVDTGTKWDAGPVEIPEYKKETKKKRMVLTYRLDANITQQIKAVAGGALPEGEVLVRLLQHAIDAYRKGEGMIKTQALEVRQIAQFVDRRTDSWT
jgi:hypothetical protein